MGGVYGVGMTGFGTVSARGISKAGSGGVRVSKSSSQKTKKKKLYYNFKQISDQILRAKTSNGARVVAIRARGKVALLQRSVGTGQYDSRELDSAITHARAMVRIAKKRMKHLLAEEKAAKQCKDGGSGIDWEEVLQEASEDAQAREESAEISEEMERLMQEFMQEMEALMEELQESTEEMNGMDDLSQELLGAISEDMEPEDLEEQKKKHRSDEMKDIVAADMRYLRALFDRLAREKAQAAQAAQMSDGGDGVSLELAGVDLSAAVPAMTSAPPPVTSEGSVIDAAV